MLPRNRAFLIVLFTLVIPVLSPVASALDDQQPIEIIAGHDGFKVPGEKRPGITVKANSVVRLQITTDKGEILRKDQDVHTCTIKDLISQGWHLILKEGTDEFTVTAPSQPGEYRVECMVFCGEIHEDMSMIMTVIP